MCAGLSVGLVTTRHATPPSSSLQEMQVASLDHAMWFHRPFRAMNGCSTTKTAQRQWCLRLQSRSDCQPGRGTCRVNHQEDWRIHPEQCIKPCPLLRWKRELLPKLRSRSRYPPDSLIVGGAVADNVRNCKTQIQHHVSQGFDGCIGNGGGIQIDLQRIVQQRLQTRLLNRIISSVSSSLTVSSGLPSIKIVQKAAVQ